MKIFLSGAVSVLLPALGLAAATGIPSSHATSPGQAPLQEYFRAETAALSDHCLAEVKSLRDWETRRAEYRRQLQEMLGLWPWPARFDLKPVVTGKLEQPDFVVEKLHFQASPGLYVTANLYLPKKVDHPLPTLLYMCGHSRVVTNGVSCGNKAGYQHHGAWFARNGYACLVIDTLQLGEIEGLHHGTYKENQWWWNSRGYTPAGVEAWFGIRALDYLCTRPEVDKDRIGMTGRSGGGSYTWTVAALDERVKVAAPIAGMTDLQNQVVDGAVEGHCDCMFFVNTYRWDFPQVAALIAPRPLLIGNSDKDKIFPLDGVIRLYEKTRRIYQLYGQTDNLGLLITDGPHADTQDLQLPVFCWFSRFLKHDDTLVEMAARKFFTPEQLRVFQTQPADQINTRIQETFVPQASKTPAGNHPDPQQSAEKLRADLRAKVFAAWPEDSPVPKPQLHATREAGGIRLESYTIEPQPGLEIPLYLAREPGNLGLPRVVLTVIDPEIYTNSPWQGVWRGNLTPDAQAAVRDRIRSERSAFAFLVPRLVAPEKALADAKKAVQLRRRFMLLGQTLDSMRVWDIRCAIRAVETLAANGPIPACRVEARGTMAVNAAYAALFEPGINRLGLQNLPQSHREGPDYLNVMRITDVGEVMAALGGRLREEW